MPSRRLPASGSGLARAASTSTISAAGSRRPEGSSRRRRPPVAEPFSYAVVRLVPDIERGERVNVGVIVFCRPLDFLGARTALDEERARALRGDVDLGA